MISILDHRVWVAAVVLCVASVGIGYWRGNVAGRASVQAKWDKERAEQQAAALRSVFVDGSRPVDAAALH